MLKLPILAFVSAYALAMPAEAMIFTKTFTPTAGTAASATITFTTSDTLDARGGYDIQNVGGNVGADLITSLLANPTPGMTNKSPDGQWIYDDVYFDNARILDSDGVVFNTASGGEYNFWGDSATAYTLASDVHNSSGQLVAGPRSNGYVGNPPPPPPPPVTHPSTTPTVLTFEELTPSASQLPPFSNPVVATQGYRFVSAGNCCNFVGTVGAGTVANGEQSLIYTHFTTTMKAVNGSAFSVTALDTRNDQNQSGAHSIVLTGTYADGSHILQTLGVGDAYQAYDLSGFTDLVSLQFGPAGSGGYTAIDNIAVVAVPEPATWGLMLMGFGAMGMATRRRRTSLVSFD